MVQKSAAVSSDVVLETAVSVSRQLETGSRSLGLDTAGLGLGLKGAGLGLGLALDTAGLGLGIKWLFFFLKNFQFVSYGSIALS